MTSLRRSAALLLVCCAMLPAMPTLAHELGIARTQLGWTAEGKLTITATVKPGLENAAPVVPAHCDLGDHSVRPAPPAELQVAWQYQCSREGFGAEDQIVMNWPVDGIFLSYDTQQFSDGAFFDATEDGIVVPVRDVLSGDSQSLTSTWLYFVFGIEHILSGWDHLAFVLLLCLIATGWRLLKLVTAFTVGHSITLILAALDLLSVPAPPVEACIALSIAIMAREVLVRQSPDNNYRIVMAFGLLHGLGFAGALRDAGFGTANLIGSLLAFNIGVEAGQLLFVVAALAVAAAGQKLAANRDWRPAIAYVIGGLGVFWVFDRSVSFFP